MKQARRDWSANVSEKAFMSQVIQLARLSGWMVAHFRPAMTQRGRWVTPVQADGAGFPDLCLVRPPRIIFAELKSQKGKATYAQETWLALLDGIGGTVECFQWRPADWDEIERILAK